MAVLHWLELLVADDTLIWYLHSCQQMWQCLQSHYSLSHGRVLLDRDPEPPECASLGNLAPGGVCIILRAGKCGRMKRKHL